MSPPGRPKGEYRSAKHEGAPASPPGRPKGEYRSAKHEGAPASPPGRPDSGAAAGLGPAAGPEWQGGWLLAARRCDSPNAGPRPADAVIDLAIIHSISLPPGDYGGDAIERLFTNRLDWEAHPYFETIRGLEVSAHFLIRRGGECLQFVSCDARAWHAGLSAWRGRKGCNDFSIGIELEGLEGGSFEPAQYEALAWLLRRVGEHYPLTAVTGHEQVAPGRKHDPGPGFDWPLLARLLPRLQDMPPGTQLVRDAQKPLSSIGD